MLPIHCPGRNEVRSKDEKVYDGAEVGESRASVAYRSHANCNQGEGGPGASGGNELCADIIVTCGHGETDILSDELRVRVD